MSLRPACGGRGGVILYLNPTGDSFLEILSLDRRDVSVMNAAEQFQLRRRSELQLGLVEAGTRNGDGGPRAQWPVRVSSHYIGPHYE